MTVDSSESRAFVRDGYFLIEKSLDARTVQRLRSDCEIAFRRCDHGVRSRKGKGSVYAARNVIDLVPNVKEVWRSGSLLSFLTNQLGADFGLVRALFFDKPPEQSWSLPWHKDLTIAVKDNAIQSRHFSNPTVKATIPHVVASDLVLQSMVTLRIHLDKVTDENGPLRVLPGSHLHRDCLGQGMDTVATIIADEGDTLAMRPLIHHSSGNSKCGSQLHRRILHLEFSSMQSLPDGAIWYHYIANRQ